MSMPEPDYLGNAPNAAALDACAPTPDICELAQAAIRQLEARYAGLRADDIEELLNNLGAFGCLFGLIEQQECLFLKSVRTDFPGGFAEHLLREVLFDQENAAAMVVFADFLCDVPEFAEGYRDGARSTVRLASA